MLPVTYNFWILYKDQGMYTIHKLHLLATCFQVADYQSSTPSYAELQATLTVWWRDNTDHNLG